jgi:hypothetical protein
MGQMGLAKPVFLDRIGAESAAKLVFDKFNDTFSKTEGGRVKVVKVECFENNKNSSCYYEDNTLTPISKAIDSIREEAC